MVWAERHAGQAGALSGGKSGAGPKQREMGPVCWAETEGWAGRVGKERGRAGLDRVLSERAVCVAGPGELRETGRGELACGPDVTEGERRDARRCAARSAVTEVWTAGEFESLARGTRGMVRCTRKQL